MENIIVTERLSKAYGDIKAVNDLSINVRKGEIYGFIGLNGAGKTTTIRMLLGMNKASSGQAYINGKKLDGDNLNLWKEIGYLVEIPYSYPKLTVRENLEISRRYRFINDKSAIDVVMDKLRISKYANRKANNLSLGNAQRLGLAKALIHNPSILILDEPSNGLDPAGIYEIRELLKELTENQGVTVFVSSHILGEVSKFSSRIGIIDEGYLIQELNASELESRCEKKFLVSTRNNDLAKLVLNQNGYNIYNNKDNIMEITDGSAIANADKIASLLSSKGCPPQLLYPEEENLESYFLRIIKKKGEKK